MNVAETDIPFGTIARSLSESNFTLLDQPKKESQKAALRPRSCFAQLPVLGAGRRSAVVSSIPFGFADSWGCLAP
jgi:hypothetical protein